MIRITDKFFLILTLSCFDPKHNMKFLNMIGSAKKWAEIISYRLTSKQVTSIIAPKNRNSMLGAGIIHNQNKLITHTTLHHSQSALFTFVPWQIVTIIFFILLTLFGIIINPLTTITVIIALLSTIYFIDVIFNVYVILKSLYFPPEITFETSEVKELENKTLPIYSILCPLYHESSVLPDFLDSINRLNWPKDKLEVLLLLEEDDQETIETANSLILPTYVKKIIVPQSAPKTKPKACNFGLSLAQGEYLVVFDAEDKPEPDQLKKAYLGFQKSSQNVVCLQAKLNYYNPHQNLLTRLFTAEYSLWFDVVLTGLQSINTAIPLGGTSNHFKTSVLKDLKGWDPFNVTEDCDLGIRLFKKGFKTAIIDSTTWEEANSDIKNWLRQRSRWIKGYLQTYLVHSRHPVKFLRRHRLHAFIFQLIIGARMSFMFINPILWLMTISYFTLYAIVGPTIESFYPAPVFYMAVISLILGNFMYAYNYMIGCAKRRQWSLIKFVYLIPFYWLMASVAAGIALYQLIVKPHYWEKTIHGLHLKPDKNQAAAAEAIIEVEEAQTGFVFPSDLRKKWASVLANRKVYFGGVLLIGASVIANFLNFVFNAYLGRVLDFRDFALIGLIGGFLSFSSILFGAFTTTANFRSGFLIGKYGENVGFAFWKYIRKKALFFSAILAVIWLLATPFLMKYFAINNAYVFILFGAVLIVGLANGADRGFLSARLMFGSLAVVNLFDPVIKLTAAIILVYFGLKIWTFSAVPLAIIGTFIIGWLLIVKQIKQGDHKTPESEIRKFPKKFFGVSILTGFSSIAFLTVDILLANHFLTQNAAGQYTLLSLVGKMVYFLGGLTTPFIVPLISRAEGANKNSNKTFYLILLFTSLLSLAGFVAFGLLGNITIPILYGKKAIAIVPYLMFFTFGMVCYTVSKVFINFYLVKKIYTFTILTSLLAVVQIILISFYHGNPGAIAVDMTVIWGLHLIVTTSLHLGIKYVKIFEDNLKAIPGLFTRVEEKRQSGLNILIFNWRDTKHEWAGGAEVYIHELAKRWVKDGNKVTLFCGNMTKRPKNDMIDGVEIIRRGGFYMVYIWAFLYYIFKFRGKYDVIIDCENGIPFFTPLYCRKPKFLLIHHVHQEVFRKSLISPLAWFASSLEAKFMPLVYRDVQVITVSPSSREEILKHKLTKTDPIIIYSGVDLNKFKPGEKSNKPMILYLGRLQYYKSLHIFIKAAKQVLRKSLETKFVIAGEGGEKRKLIKQAKRLGILENIKFLGRVSEKAKIKLFQEAWVFVNPSFMEGWGLTTIEANACGTPAVASNVPGLRDSIKNPHTGFLVPYGKPSEFADRILELIEDKHLRKQFSKEAIKWANNFTWEKSAMEFYSVVIDRVRIKKEPAFKIADTYN